MKGSIKLAAKLALAGAALAGGTANAALIGNTGAAGASDLVLFVTNTSTNASFVGDLGITLDDLKTLSAVAADNSSSTFYNAGGTGTTGSINMPSGLNYTNSNLTTFLAGCSTNCQWTVLGTNPQSGSTSAMIGFTSTNTPATEVDVSGPLVTNDLTGGSAINVNAFLAQVNTQGADYTNNVSLVSGDGWLPLNSNHNSMWMGVQPDGAALGTSQYLYVIAGTPADPNGLAGVYAGQYQLALSTTGGLTISGGSTAVPLPAAAWLFGSGLLGLAGIGRRRGLQALAA
jgi:hypothetical protein